MSLKLNEAEQTVLNGLTDKYSEVLIDVYQSCGHTYFVIEASSLLEISRFLKEEHHFLLLSDIIGTDRYTSRDRFEVIYNLLNLRAPLRIFVKIRVPEENPTVDSVSSVWSSANWHEREVYDMFGIRFNDHPDPRRIFMPDDYEYFPLRKEFPLLGIPGSIELPNTTPEID